MTDHNDDALSTAAVFLGGGVAGYALGRWVIARWLDPEPTATNATGSSATPTTGVPTTIAANQTVPVPPAAPPVTPTPGPVSPTQQARTPPAPSRSPRKPREPRPTRRPTDADVGPVSSPSQVEHSTASPLDGPVTSPSQVERARAETTGTVSAGPSAYYKKRASRLFASIPRRVERTRELIAQWSTYLDRYRGGLPRGVFAAVMQMESDGRPRSKGDASLGEVGLFQITEGFPRSLGLDPRLRHRNEWNFFFAGTEYNQAAWRWQRRHPDLIAKGSRDAWLLARLSFAIGDGGARSHVNHALRAEPQVAHADGVYAALVAFIRKGGARTAGSQSAEKVAYRIAVVVPTNFDIGELAEPLVYGDYGVPVRLSPPAS